MKTLGYDHEAIPNPSRNENSKPWKNPTPRGTQIIDIPKRKNFVTPLSNQPRTKIKPKKKKRNLDNKWDWFFNNMASTCGHVRIRKKQTKRK